MARTKEIAYFDVVIIGLGPTGAMLANLLGMKGLSTLVLEREQRIYDLPRAVHFDDEVMRAFQTIGIADTFSKKVIVNKGMRFCDYDGNLLMDWPRPQKKTSNGWYGSYRFHQPDLEAELRKALQNHPSVKVLLGHCAESFRETADLVEIVYRDLQTDNCQRVTANFVVGCDGARSTVRESMNSGMEQLGFEQRWLVVDLMLNRNMPELGDHTIQYCDPDRPATYCRNSGMRRRWEFALCNGESEDEATKHLAIWERLRRWLSPGDAELERAAVYTFKSCVAESWRIGRLILAGDAAHLTPPFMGQGMCAGIRDTINLAWKLELECSNLAPVDLLDSYQSERKSNVTQYIKTAVNLGELINRAGANLLPAKPARMESTKFKLGPGLGKETDPLRGVLFPQVVFASGRNMDDVVGYEPFVLGMDCKSSFGAKAAGGVSADQFFSCDGEPQLTLAMEQLGVREIMVRPDRYILASVPANTSANNWYTSAMSGDSTKGKRTSSPMNTVSTER